MAGALANNYNELCRLCASKTNVLISINIFEGEGSVREIDKKISTCLPIQIHEADHLPKVICSDCLNKLESFFTFREKTIQTETLLIALVKKIDQISSLVDITRQFKAQIADDTTTTNLELIERAAAGDDNSLDETQMSMIPPPANLLDPLAHELTVRDAGDSNMMMNDDELILGTHSDTMAHDLENIQILPNELNTHDASMVQQLVQQNMQISQLTVQNLELMHHNFNPASYDETIPEKLIENEDSCGGLRPLLTLKHPRDLMPVIDEDKNDRELETIKAYTNEPSDSESSSAGEFQITIRREELKNEIICSNLYENQILLQNNTEVETSESSGKKVQYSCDICGKISVEKNAYLMHYGEHFNKCLLCEEQFSTLEDFQMHHVKAHMTRRQSRNSPTHNKHVRLKDNSSDSVDDNFFKEESSEDEKSSRETRSEYVPHEDDASNNEYVPDEDEDDEPAERPTKRRGWQPKVCTVCKKSYKTNYKLAEHMRKHTGEQPFKCSMCDKAFRSKIGLAQHEAKHTGQFDYACSTCGKGFQCRSYLIVHQRVHSDLKPFPCATCNKNFKTKQSLLDHMNRHLGVKPYVCEVCGRSFITKGLCKSHQKVHSGTDNRQFPCNVCNKLFVSKSYLATHARIHTGEKPFICEVCGKGFLTRVDLKIHSTMHTGEKSFVCEMCGKAFARRDALRCHRRSHTGERPYRCDICGQTFTQFSPMAIHKRLHTGERPYACEVCNKTFVSRSTMMSHHKKHLP